MKERQVYYRRKDKSIVIEGKEDGKSVLIWTLPNDPTCLLEFLIKASYFTQEKSLKISEKLKRLDIRVEKLQKNSSNIPLIKIKRTDEKDEIEEEIEPNEEELELSLLESEVKKLI